MCIGVCKLFKFFSENCLKLPSLKTSGGWWVALSFFGQFHLTFLKLMNQKNSFFPIFCVFELPDECMVCYERFPVSLQLSCGHELCALCAESILAVCDNNNCPKCRAPLPHLFSEWLTMIKIYPIQFTPDIPLGKLQHAFPLICSVPDLTIVAKCIDMGLNVNTEGICGYFPVHFASQKNVVEFLVNKGADVNQSNYRGITPLMLNSNMGNLLVVKSLIKNGAKINQVPNNAATSLFASSHKGYLPVVKYLVQNGADVNQADIEGITPLSISSQNGHLSVVKYLIQNGANINQADNEGITPLSVSCEQCHLSVVKYLIENGADVNQATKSGATPLLFALHTSQTEIAKLLLRKNANVETTKLLLVMYRAFELYNILDELCKEMQE